MYIQQQPCSLQGHEGWIITQICTVSNCSQYSRYMCDKCIEEIGHLHDHNCEFKQNIMEIEKFIQYLKDQRLPQIELRRKGNQAKLKYFTKIYDVLYYNDRFQSIPQLRISIENLIQEYQSDIVQAQLLCDIYNQLTLYGLQSLNTQQLNILLENQFKFINQEFKILHMINQIINQQQQIHDLINPQINELSRINDYLNIQEYSINGDRFIFFYEEFLDSSFFSKNHRYFAMFNKKDYKMRIRKQINFHIAHQLTIESQIRKIQFDPSFNKCVIQGKEGNIFYYYNKNRHQFKLVKKFKFELVQDFILDNQNRIIIFLNNMIVIQALNYKNQQIKLIQFSYILGNFCYGMEKNVIAINNQRNIQIYFQMGDKWQLIQQQVNYQFSDMMFTNHDSQLLTKDKDYIKLWQINNYNQTIKQLYQMAIKKDSVYYFQSKTEFNAISINFQGEIQFLDKNFNIQISLDSCFTKVIYLKSVQLTKHFLIISYRARIQVIKLRSIYNYKRLEKMMVRYQNEYSYKNSNNQF